MKQETLNNSLLLVSTHKSRMASCGGVIILLLGTIIVICSSAQLESMGWAYQKVKQLSLVLTSGCTVDCLESLLSQKCNIFNVSQSTVGIKLANVRYFSNDNVSLKQLHFLFETVRIFISNLLTTNCFTGVTMRELFQPDVLHRKYHKDLPKALQTQGLIAFTKATVFRFYHSLTSCWSLVHTSVITSSSFF